MASPYPSEPYWHTREVSEYPPVEVVPPPRPLPRQRIWLHVFLFALTVLSTITVGGILFSAALLSILLAHEFGHALGLGHIQNPKAIMFSRTNQIVALSPDDQAALAEFCRERSVGEMLQKRLQSVSDLYLGGKVFTFSH